MRHNLQWETTWRDLSVLNRTTAFEIREMSGPSLKGSLRHILSVDRRDQPIFPRSGTLWRITTEYAGIGGNVNFLKNEAHFQANIPLSNDVVRNVVSYMTAWVCGSDAVNRENADSYRCNFDCFTGVSSNPSWWLVKVHWKHQASKCL